jgi:CubicO group peptidase (beta-lactamase class C family)
MTFSLFDLAFVGSLTGAVAYDPDAQTYITAVETADGQALEVGVKDAINDFVVGCKADGIWAAIKASCILAGARTLAGALVPLVGAAPTKEGTEGGWSYDRKTGLAGNGTDNRLDGNRNNNADPQDSNHNAVYQTAGGGGQRIGSGFLVDGANSIANTAHSNRRGFTFNFTAQNGLIGHSRDSGASYIFRNAASNSTIFESSETPQNANIRLFQFTGAAGFGTHRLAFYSIGESLDLALLDARVTALINAFDAAI